MTSSELRSSKIPPCDIREEEEFTEDLLEEVVDENRNKQDAGSSSLTPHSPPTTANMSDCQAHSYR